MRMLSLCERYGPKASSKATGPIFWTISSQNLYFRPKYVYWTKRYFENFLKSTLIFGQKSQIFSIMCLYLWVNLWVYEWKPGLLSPFGDITSKCPPTHSFGGSRLSSVRQGGDVANSIPCERYPASTAWRVLMNRVRNVARLCCTLRSPFLIMLPGRSPVNRQSILMHWMSYCFISCVSAACSCMFYN